jgi:hypothetical protein
MSGEAASKNFEETFKAARDLSAHQFKGVILTADDQMDVPTAAGAVCAGVLQDKPSAVGRAGRVVFLGKTKAYLSGSVSYGDRVSMTTSGWFILATSGYPAHGFVTQDANSGYPAEIVLDSPASNLSTTSAAAGEI